MRGDMSSIQGKLEVMETKQVTRKFCQKKILSKKILSKNLKFSFCSKSKKVNVNPTMTHRKRPIKLTWELMRGEHT